MGSLNELSVRPNSSVCNKGKTIETKSIRHLGGHESVICVLHLDKDQAKNGGNISVNLPQIKQKNSKRKEKSVHFGEVDCVSKNLQDITLDDSACSSSSGNLHTSNSSADSSSSEDIPSKNIKNRRKGNIQIKIDKCARNFYQPRIMSAGSAQGSSNTLDTVESRVRKTSVPLKPSPLLIDSTPGNKNKNGSSIAKSQLRSLDSLGLSPAIQRKNRLLTPTHNSDDDTSSVASNRSLKSCSTSSIYSKQNSNKSDDGFPKSPLDSGLIGSEEELQQLRFIKNALSTSPVPVSPEVFRRRLNTDGAAVEKRRDDKRINVPLEEFRARVDSMESAKKKKNKHRLPHI